jgi:hypothetical protein
MAVGLWFNMSEFSGAFSCGAVGPFWKTSRTPDHGSGLRGGMNRLLPAVEAP